MPTLEEELIADILLGSPGHLGGTRPIHAPGIAATGWFQASDIAAASTSAAHFDGRPVPVTARFSDATRLPVWPDSKPAVRGMAVKFHLSATSETDMVGVTIGVFFCRTIELFREFCVATTPVHVIRRPWWDKIREILMLREPAPEPAEPLSGDQTVFEYAHRHPAACPAVAALGAMVVPESYLACRYHPLHTFKLTAGDATRYVRFH